VIACPRLTVEYLLKLREAQLKKDRESGTKQPNTELSDLLDRWQQHLDNGDTTLSDRLDRWGQHFVKNRVSGKASKDAPSKPPTRRTKQPDTGLSGRHDRWQRHLVKNGGFDKASEDAPLPMRARDRRDSLSLGRSAKRARSRDDDIFSPEPDDKTLDSQSNSDHSSQKSTRKKRRKTSRKQEILIRVASDDHHLSKDDWKEIFASSVDGNNSTTASLYKDIGSLRSSVDQLFCHVKQTNQMLQQLLIIQQHQTQPDLNRPAEYPSEAPMYGFHEGTEERLVPSQGGRNKKQDANQYL
jgi:hypothetical protein